MMFDPGFTDQFGTPIDDYQLVFDFGLLDASGHFYGFVMQLIFSLMLNTLTLGLAMMNVAANPAESFAGIRTWYENHLVEPLFQIVPMNLFVGGCVAAMLVLAGWRFFATGDTSSTIGADLKRILGGFIMASVVVTLAARPFAITDLALGLTQEIGATVASSSSDEGSTANISQRLVSSVVTPVAQTLNFGGQITDRTCATQWASQLQSDDPGVPKCLDGYADHASWSRVGSSIMLALCLLPFVVFAMIVFVAVFWYMLKTLLFSVLILFGAAISITQRKGFSALGETASRCFGSAILLCITLFVVVVTPTLVTGIAHVMSTGMHLGVVAALGLAYAVGYTLAIVAMWWVLSNSHLIYGFLKANAPGVASKTYTGTGEFVGVDFSERKPLAGMDRIKEALRREDGTADAEAGAGAPADPAGVDSVRDSAAHRHGPTPEPPTGQASTTPATGPDDVPDTARGTATAASEDAATTPKDAAQTRTRPRHSRPDTSPTADTPTGHDTDPAGHDTETTGPLAFGDPARRATATAADVAARDENLNEGREGVSRVGLPVPFDVNTDKDGKVTTLSLGGLHRPRLQPLNGGTREANLSRHDEGETHDK